MILAIRTDKPEAEIYLLDSKKKIVEELKWQAHRQLSVTIHGRIEQVLKNQNIKYDNLTGVICYEGPGSFTGLRIGLTVANTLAQQLSLPISGASGEQWMAEAIKKLDRKGNNIILPVYGSDPHITIQKK